MKTGQGRKSPEQGLRPVFWWAVWAWTGSLLVLATINQAVSGILSHGAFRALDIVFFLPGWAGLFLPFCVFAGGVAASRTAPTAKSLRQALLIVATSYALLAFGAPIGEYQIDENRAAQVAEAYPFGPRTPVALAKLRSAVEAAPPERFSFRIDEPFSAPPNWLTYLLHSPAVFALYSLLSMLLGRTVGSMTTGLPPPRRGHVRWAAGLALGIVFFLAEARGGEWVRLDPSRSGLLGAWLPLFVPSALLVFLHLVHRTRMEDADSSGSRREPE